MSLITPRPRHEDPMNGNTAASWSKSEDPQPVTDFVVGDADADSDEADNLKADKAHDAPDSVELVVSAALGASSSEDEREDRAKSPACMSQEEVMRQLAADMLDDSEEGSDGEIHLGGGLAAAIDAFELDDDEDEEEEFTLDSSPIRDPAARDARQRASDSDSSSDDGEVPPPYKSANPWAAAAEEETCGLSDGEGEDFGDTDDEELEMDLHEEQYNHAACQPQPHPIPGLDLDLQRQQVQWERSQRQSEFWARMGRDALLNEDDQRVALKILLQEAHRHHRRAREAGKPATSDFRWAAIAHDAMEEFEISGHSAVQRSISCMCLFSPASSASIYGEHEAERMRRAGRQQQTLQMLRLQAMCGGNEFFLAQPQPSHPRPE